MPTEYDKIINRLWWKATIGYDEMREAAEFEARVAVNLAERCVLLEKVAQKALGVAEYINLSAAAENTLKAARLQVEEEMVEEEMVG